MHHHDSPAAVAVAAGSDAVSVAPGSRLGPYEIVEKLGEGGMGAVFLARDTRLPRRVAIKVLPAEVASDARVRLRLEKEAKAISSLEHPHICALHDIGREGDSTAKEGLSRLFIGPEVHCD